MATETELKKYAKMAHKPFDIVQLEDGSIGYIKEVSINKCQEGFNNCISYSLHWIKNVGSHKVAWFSHSELKNHIIGNFIREISRSMCHPFGNSGNMVDLLFQETDE
jgi:hypothetical protein